MICIQCKTENPANQAFCDNCGFELTSPMKQTATGLGHDQPKGGSYFGEEQTNRLICNSCGYSSPPNAIYCGYCQALLPLLPGAKLGNDHWTITSLLRQGGMGRVYIAQDNQTRSRVVIKELLDEQGRPENERKIYLEHFTNEAKVLGSLSQIRSVPRLLSDVVQEGKRYYFAMEFIDGLDLDEVITRQKRALDVNTAVDYAIKLCEVLEILHNRTPPILHRDIKPENLRLRTADNSIALIDFGIARNVRDGTKLTKVGTSGFVAPEQLRGNAEPRSDLYSLAATLYFLLTTQILDDTSDRYPGALRRINYQVSEDLEEIILANLNENPAERFESATEFKNDLLQGKLTKLVRCSKCGTLNDRRLIYCTNDAAPLSNRSRQCSNCSAFVPLRARFCPQCGHSNS